MLEGLEISEILKSELERTLRIDSEFYSKENLKVIDILSNHKLKDVTEIAKVSDGNHLAISNSFTNNGIPYYRGQNIHYYFIEESNPICIDQNTFDLPLMKRSHLKKGDVLLSIVGTIGGVALVSSNVNATCNCKLAILRPKNIDGFFLSAFLKSKYGQNQIKKFTRGAVQKGLILEDMNQIFIPVLDTVFQTKVSELIQLARSKSDKTKINYKKAETILLNEVGMQNFNPTDESVNIKRFKDSFGLTKRLDAEYYQKKYEQVIDKIISQKHDSLINIVDILKSIEPGSDNYSEEEGLPFYRVSDYNKFGLSQPDKNLTDLYVSNNKKLIEKLMPKKGTILFSKDGSVGIAYLLRQDLDGITSGAILHLVVRNKNEIIPEYLTLVLNSKLVQMQAERDAGGSIILHWRKEEIEQVVVPIIDYYKQKQIAELVEESFKLKVESERLLEVAKKAVEIAIEENESSALKFINKNIG